MKNLFFILVTLIFGTSITHNEDKCKQYYPTIPMKECHEMLLIEKNFGLYDNNTKIIALNRVQEIKNLALPIRKQAEILSKKILYDSDYILSECNDESLPKEIREYIKPYYETFNKLSENAKIDVIQKKIDAEYEIQSESAKNYLQTKNKFLNITTN